MVMKLAIVMVTITINYHSGKGLLQAYMRQQQRNSGHVTSQWHEEFESNVNYTNGNLCFFDLHEKASKDCDEDYPFAKKGRLISPITYPTKHDLHDTLCITHLLILVLISRARSENVSRSTVLVGAVLERELAQSRNHVLNGRVLGVAVLAAELVEPGDLVERVVNNGNDDGDTNRVGPDDNNGDNVNVSVLTELAVKRGRVGLVVSAGQPAEGTEDGGQSIDTQDGAHELERGERLSATGDEDEPVLGKTNLKEEDGLDSAEVLNDTTVGQKESSTDDPSA